MKAIRPQDVPIAKCLEKRFEEKNIQVRRIEQEIEPDSPHFSKKVTQTGTVDPYHLSFETVIKQVMFAGSTAMSAAGVGRMTQYRCVILQRF